MLLFLQSRARHRRARVAAEIAEPVPEDQGCRGAGLGQDAGVDDRQPVAARESRLTGARFGLASSAVGAATSRRRPGGRQD